MKKILISLLLLVPLVSGCANVDTRININKDYSASVVTSLTYEGDLSSNTDPVAEGILANYNDFLDPMYNTENAYGAKLSTITAEKSVKNLKYDDLDLSSLGFVSNLPSKKFIEVKKNFLVTSVNIDATYDFPAQADKYTSKVQKDLTEKKIEVADSGMKAEYLHKYADPSELEPENDSEFDLAANLDDATKQLMQEPIAGENADTNVNTDANNVVNESTNKKTEISDFVSSFSIKVPGLASYNNSDAYEDGAYVWNVKKDESTVIKLQYVRYSGFAICFVILVGVLLLVLLARKILKRDSQKRIDNIDNIV